MCMTMYRNLHTLQYTGTPCPRTVIGFCRCFAFRIGKIRSHYCTVRNFQFRKFLPPKSNYLIEFILNFLRRLPSRKADRDQNDHSNDKRRKQLIHIPCTA